MVEQVLQRRRNSVVVLAADNGKSVDLAIELGQILQYRRSAAALVFLVHAVEQGQTLLGSIHYGDCVAAPAQRSAEKPHYPNAHSRLAY